MVLCVSETNLLWLFPRLLGLFFLMCSGDNRDINREAGIKSVLRFMYAFKILMLSAQNNL